MSDSHPHLGVARQLWNAVAEGDADAIKACFEEEIVWRTMGNHSLSGEYFGPDGVIDYLAGIGERADELNSTLTSIFTNDDGAVLIYHVSARRGKVRMQMDVALLLLVRDGKISHATLVPFDQVANDRFWV